MLGKHKFARAMKVVTLSRSTVVACFHSSVSRCASITSLYGATHGCASLFFLSHLAAPSAFSNRGVRFFVSCSAASSRRVSCHGATLSLSCLLVMTNARGAHRTPFDDRDERSADLYVRGAWVMPCFVQNLLPLHLELRCITWPYRVYPFRWASPGLFVPCRGVRIDCLLYN